MHHSELNSIETTSKRMRHVKNAKIEESQFLAFFQKILKIELKKNFPNRFFVFLLECVRGRVVHNPIWVPGRGHFFKVAVA